MGPMKADFKTKKNIVNSWSLPAFQDNSPVKV